MDEVPSFPPLFSGLAVAGATDPFFKARAMALQGCDAGLIVHNIQVDRLRAAIVFAPEVPLEDAMAMLPACGVGFQNALGALAPPEVAVHLEWEGAIRINGALCGSLAVDASSRDPAAMPDWLIVGLELPLMGAGNPGDTPDRTSLMEEGCTDVSPVSLVESWARHTLVWINRWMDDGNAPLHAEWMGLAHNVGENVVIDGRSGTFVGVDEKFGMLLRENEETSLIPLSSRLAGD